MAKKISGLLLLVSACLSSLAQLSFTNAGSEIIHLAVGFHDGVQWVTKGWYSLEPGDTKALVAQSGNPNYYYYGTIGACDATYKGDSKLVIDPRNAFNIKAADKQATLNANSTFEFADFVHVKRSGPLADTIKLTHDNLICHGKRQGHWKVMYDRDWEETKKEEDAYYYRMVDYEKGVPDGYVRDYYVTGELQWKGKLVAENPDVQNGTSTWYYQDGTKQQECVYDWGKLVAPCKHWTEAGELVEFDFAYQTRSYHVQKFYVNGGRNATFLGGTSRILIPVKLPPNTVKWYYEFTASRNEADVDRITGTFSLAADLTNLIDKTGLVSFAVDALTQPPGGNYCDVFLLDLDNSRNFKSKVEFDYIIEGSRSNFKSGIVEIGCCPQGYFIGIRNPSAGHGIHVAIQIVAIVQETELKPE